MERLDNVLVKKGFFESRNKAIYEIKSNNVLVNGKVENKPSKQINIDDKIEIINKLKYVSKGGLKLEKAINEFNLDLSNKIMLDIGSSTGGFSDVALRNNIKKIIAVDVGVNQFNKKLLESNKIDLYENTDIREFDVSKYNIDFVTIDVSFISVTKIIPKLSEIKDLKEIVVLVKPQFECGKALSDKYKGIPLNKEIHKSVIKDITVAFKTISFYIQNITFSPIKGGSGNIEYLAYFKNEEEKVINIDKIIQDAFINL